MTGRDARWVAGALLGLALVALLLAGVEHGRRKNAMRAAFPPVGGRLSLAGLDAPAQVLRDRRGVPHVLAESEHDALLVLGYVHAQDRLAQMQWLVRLARGRTAEVLGAPGLAADRLARTLDLAGVADREAERLEGPTKLALEAYAVGVNARIARARAGEVPPPLAWQTLGLPLEDWQPADSLAVLKFYAWSLSESLAASLVLDDLLSRLGGVSARRFFPGPARPDRVPAPDGPPVTAGLWRDPLRRAAGLEGRSAGSSAWVLGGAHTASGAPLLAADLHLEPTVPPLLHVVHIRGGALDVAGATLPGVPGVWTGHNRRVAWAATHAGAAVTDLYNERLHPAGEPLYHDGRGWQRLEEREETIAVRGEQAEVLRVRLTHHGPLVHELLGGDRDPLAVAWVGLRGQGAQTLAALLEMARASDADALVAALAKLSEPAVAVVYADADGVAGMQVAGWLPRRALTTELVPVPGRARWYDWEGRVPFDQLPALRLADGQGWAIAADNVLESEAGARSEWLWRSGARARRLDAGLRQLVREQPVDLRGLAALQSDVVEPRARLLVDAALGLVADGEPLAGEAAEVAALLRSWDGVSVAQSVGAAAYHVFLVQLTHALLAGQLSEPLLKRYVSLPQADPGQIVLEIVSEAAAGAGEGGWAGRQQVADAVRESLREAWFELSFRLGGSRTKWEWGRLHTIAFRPFVPASGRSPLGPFEAGGSGSTVAAAEYAPADPYAVRVASTYRFAVDTSALDRSLTALAPGESEHPGHSHYADGLPGWLEGRSGVLVTGPLLVEEAATSRLVLEPAP